MTQDHQHHPSDGIINRYRRIAPLYDLVDWPFERVRYRRLRRRLCSDVSGDILEAGVGTGKNLPFYPAQARVTGLELSPAMLERARGRAESAPATIRLVEGDITDTGLPDASFDAVVASFTLCVLAPKQRPIALAEMARLLRPGGTIRLLEYQRSNRVLRRAIMRLWEPWVRWAFGADFDLDLDGLAATLGLQVVESRPVVADIIRYVELRT
jgi:ubiquinone/menaquinone biosynthesis C-methylase UbiE